MKNLLIIGTNNSYIAEIRRAAPYRNYEVVGLCSGIEDTKEFFEQGGVADVVIASDNLFVGDSLLDVVALLRLKGYTDNVFYALKHDTYKTHLFQMKCQYVFENDVAPIKLLDMIEEAMAQRTYRQQFQQDLYNNPNRGYETQQPSNTMQNPYSHNRRPEPVDNYYAPRRQFKPMMITINSPKGGVGKTSLAIELSTVLANRATEITMNPASRLNSSRVEVCLVDFNPSFDTMASCFKFVRQRADYPTVTDWVNAIEEKIYQNLTSEQRKRLRADEDHDFTPYLDMNTIYFSREEVKRLLLRDEETGLYVLPSVSLPFDVEYVTPEYLRIILQQIQQVFDVVVVDTGNNISFFTVEALRAADEIFLVTAPTSGSTSVLGKLTKNIERLRLSREKINLIVNFPNGSETTLEPERIAEALNLPLVSVLPFDEGIRHSHEKGEPYAVHNKKSAYTHEIVKLAQQICPLWTSVQKNQSNRGKKKKKRGFLSFFFQ